ncbi:hypothetical protein B1R32_10259 [Abditibacterium utsteinense]|uniref:Membrane protein YfhO n=1 Tax=Abditibacterium utsteinense TaxID=1960156 RepID=A0A2S8SW83_9BACT|nr:hypothetical protein [Abditibacterium utsteinense]PQV65052.1 hypothetical protein B1R32_10259 [Abditibacterium utsteinense]
MKNRRCRLLVLVMLLAFLAHAPALLGAFGGALPSTGDTLGAFAPWHQFARGELHRNGAIPLWNPHVLAGVPFAGNGQSALFYPPIYLHFLLPEGIALWLFAFGHSVFFMLGGYFLGRTLGLERRAAFLVAVLLGFGNATPAHLFGGHLTFLPARSFWPWQAAFLLRMLRAKGLKTALPNAIAWAACISLGLAAGAPQIWLFGVLFNGALFGFWSFREVRNRSFTRNFPWKSAASALSLAALWCAPTLLPLRELKSWSSHGDLLSFAEVVDLSATPRSVFRLLFNGFFGGNSFVMWSLPSNPGEDAASIGIAGAVLAFAAPFFATRSRVVTALLMGCAFSVLLSLGDATPLYRALYDQVFLFQITRVPARWLELWAFGAAILAGFCLDDCLKNPHRSQKMMAVWATSALLCLALLVGTIISQSLWRHGAEIVARAYRLPSAQITELSATLHGEALFSVVLATSTLGLLAFFWRRGLQGHRALALIVALFVAEPLLNFWISVRIAPPENVQSAQVPPSLAARYQAGERWIVRAPFQQLNAPLWSGIDALNGYEPFGSAPFFEFARGANPETRFSADFQPQKMNPLWRVAGASHLLWKPKNQRDTSRGFPGKLVARADEWRLNSIEDGLKPWPRAYLTRDIKRAEAQKTLEILQKLAAQPFGIAPPAVVSPDFPTLDKSALQSRETVRLVFSSPDVRRWEIAPSRASFFVENEAMAPGWKAYLDDKPSAIVPANSIFRGVVVPAQTKRVALIYNSNTLRFALFLALCGLSWAAAVLFPVFSRAKNQANQAAASDPPRRIEARFPQQNAR